MRTFECAACSQTLPETRFLNSAWLLPKELRICVSRPRGMWPIPCSKATDRQRADWCVPWDEGIFTIVEWDEADREPFFKRIFFSHKEWHHVVDGVKHFYWNAKGSQSTVHPPWARGGTSDGGKHQAHNYDMDAVVSVRTAALWKVVQVLTAAGVSGVDPQGLKTLQAAVDLTQTALIPSLRFWTTKSLQDGSGPLVVQVAADVFGTVVAAAALRPGGLALAVQAVLDLLPRIGSGPALDTRDGVMDKFRRGQGLASRRFLSLSECQAYVLSEQPDHAIYTAKAWERYCRAGLRPDNVPGNLHDFFGRSWPGWGIFLKTGGCKRGLLDGQQACHNAVGANGLLCEKCCEEHPTFSAPLRIMRQTGQQAVSPALPDRMDISYRAKERQVRLAIARLASTPWDSNPGERLPVNVMLLIFSMVLDGLGYRGGRLPVTMCVGEEPTWHAVKGSRQAQLPETSILRPIVDATDGELPRLFPGHGSVLPRLDAAFLDHLLGPGKAPAARSRERLAKLCSLSTGTDFVGRWLRGKVQIFSKAHGLAWYVEPTLFALDQIFTFRSARNFAWDPQLRGPQPLGDGQLDSAAIGIQLADARRLAYPGEMGKGPGHFMEETHKEHGLEVGEASALSFQYAGSQPPGTSPADIVVADTVIKRILNGEDNAAVANALHNHVLAYAVWLLNKGMNTAQIADAWSRQSTFTDCRYGTTINFRHWVTGLQNMAHYLRVKKKRFALNLHAAAKALPAGRAAPRMLEDIAHVLNDQAAAHW